MAQQLIDSLSAPFDPTKYRDEYRERVLDLIERKAAGEEIAVQPEAEEPAPAPDLMAALEASLAAVAQRQLRRVAATDKRRAKAPARKRASQSEDARLERRPRRQRQGLAAGPRRSPSRARQQLRWRYSRALRLVPFGAPRSAFAPPLGSTQSMYS